MIRPLLLLLILTPLLVRPHAAAADGAVTVFAAASLTSALQEVWPTGADPRVRLAFGSSSSLARQIDAGAPADLFLSANERWMDDLQARGRIDTTTRVDLLGNRLVIVAPRGEAVAVEPRPDFDLAGAFRGRLALGDPDHVPAGIYARQALTALGWWPALQQRLAPAADVRAALVLVERGECPVGIVYATDAALSDRVEVVATLPDSLHEPIRYPVAIVLGRATPAVRAVYDQLRGAAAAAVLTRHGFIILAGGDPGAGRAAVDPTVGEARTGPGPPAASTADTSTADSLGAAGPAPPAPDTAAGPTQAPDPDR